MIEAWFDGAFLWDEGHAAYGAVVKENGKIIFSEAKYMGANKAWSPNVAEYGGLMAVYRFLISAGVTKARIYGDSSMVINQMSGKWKAKGGAYLNHYAQAKQLRNQLPPLEYRWIRRQFNEEADALSKEPLIGFYREPKQSESAYLDHRFELAISE